MVLFGWLLRLYKPFWLGCWPICITFYIDTIPPRAHRFQDVIEMDDDVEDDDGILPRLFEIDYAGGVVAGKKGIDTLGIGGYQV